MTAVLSGDELAIELPNGDTVAHFAVHAGQVDWDEPFDRAHRGVNTGRTPYEEIAIFFWMASTPCHSHERRLISWKSAAANDRMIP